MDNDCVEGKNFGSLFKGTKASGLIGGSILLKCAQYRELQLVSHLGRRAGDE